VTISEFAPYLGLVGSLGVIIFVALRFQRTDAGAVVTQQAQVFDNLRDFTNELQEQLKDARGERRRVEAELATARQDLRDANGERDRLRAEVRDLEAQLSERIVKQQELERRLVELGETPDG
jgi:chromosome segregation ATPase